MKETTSPFRFYNRVEALNFEMNFRSVQTWLEWDVEAETMEGYRRACKLAVALFPQYTDGCTGADPLAIALLRRRQRRWLARMAVQTREAEFVWAAMVQYQQETRKACLQLIGGGE